MRTLISLGYRCETAFQIRIHSGINRSHFFDWMMTPLLPKITAVIESDFDALRPEDLCIRVNKAGDRNVFDSRRHLSLPHAVPLQGASVVADWQEYIPDYTAKMQHIAGNFRKAVTAGPVTFIRRNATVEQAQALERVLMNRFSTADIRVLYVLSEPEVSFQTELGDVVYLPDIGPHGDDLAWSAMLLEQGLIEKPFRLSRSQIMKPEHGLGAPIMPVNTALYAVERNPENPWFLYETARAYMLQHDRKTAADYIARAVEMDTGNTMFADLLNTLMKQRQASGRALSPPAPAAHTEPAEQR